MAQDEPRAKDETREIGGFTFIVDKDVSGFTGDITVDASARGFEVYSGPGMRKTGCGCSK